MPATAPLPPETFTLPDKGAGSDYKKASSAPLTDKIYRITPRGAGLVTGKQGRVGSE